MKGHIEIEGQKYYLSAWKGEKNGNKYLSGVAELPQQNDTTKENDDLPF